MRVSEAMTRDVRIANPGQSIREVAKIMATSMPARCRWARTTAWSA